MHYGHMLPFILFFFNFTNIYYFLDHIYRIMNLTKEFSGKEENVLAVNSKSMFIVQYNILNKTKKKKTNVHIDFL